MRKKIFSILLSVAMVMVMMPSMAFATTEEAPSTGYITPITEGGSVVPDTNSTQVTFGITNPVPWSKADPSIYRWYDGWWVGATIYAPKDYVLKGAENGAKYQTGEGAGWSAVKNFETNRDSKDSDSRQYIKVWGMITPEYLINAKKLGKNLEYKWRFNWDASTEEGDSAYEAEYKMVINPNDARLYDKDGANVIYPTAEEGCTSVASVQGSLFTSLQAAVDKAGKGDKVVLLRSVDGDGIITQADDEFVLDLNNKTYTINKTVGSAGTETNGMQLFKGGKITIENGAIDFNFAKLGIKNYCNLTLNNIHIANTATANPVINNCGQLTINGEDTVINSGYKWGITTGNYNKDDVITTTINAGNISSVACETPLWEIGGATVNESVTTAIKGGQVDKIGVYDWRPEYGPDYANAPLLENWKMNIEGGVIGEIEVGDSNIDKVSITGGSFSTDPKAYLASGSEKNIYKYSDTKYVVSATKPANTSAYHSWVWDEATRYNVESYNPPAPSTPVEKDPVSNEGTAGTDDATTSADITDKVTTSDGKTEAVVDQDIADKIVDKAVENKSTEVVVEATTAAGTSDASQVALPETTVKAIAEQTDAALTIKTDNAEVTLDKEAVSAVADQAGTTGTVKLVVETVENTAEKVVVELKLETSNGYVSDFKGGNVTVTVPVAKDMADKKVVCVYIDDNGIYTKVEGQLNADGTYTFKTGHFSTYAIMSEEEADAVIKDQTAAARKAAIKKVKTTVTLSTKNVKKGIKVTVKVPVDQKADKTGIILYRSMKKDSGYAMYKKVETKSSTYIITNTKNVKGNRLTAGKRYYYKARAYKVIDGKTYYGPMSTVKYMKAK